MAFVIDPAIVVDRFDCKFPPLARNGGITVNREYRGHCIQLTCHRLWDAVIVDTETGVMLPTKATALLREGRGVAIARACKLIDLYVEAGYCGTA